MITKKYIPACICVGLVVFSLFFSSPARAANFYYVSTSGNDSNPGTLALPFRTIQKGVSVLTPGDTLFVRGGTYLETISIGVSGSSTAPITISSFPGETPIIDGNNTLPGYIYSPLVSMHGSYLIFDGFEVKNSTGRGIQTDGSDNIIKNNNVHYIQDIGIYSAGSYNTIENNKVWRAVDSNYTHGGTWPGALAFGSVNSPNDSPYVIVRNNEVYQNSGEGILCLYTDNGIIEGNIVRDNWAEDIYLDTCSYTTIRNNLTYYTTDKQFWRGTNSPQGGIVLSNEGRQTYPIGHDRKIYNNISVNAGSGISFWTGYASGSALINDTIAFNTIVNNYSYGTGINVDSGPHQNTVIEDNLILVNLGTPLNSPSRAGLTFSSNLWSKNPVFLGSGDVVGNPLLSNPTQSVDVSIDPSWYQLTESSPAIGKALALPDVQTDYFGTPRDSAPDMGADEFQSSVQPTVTQTSTLIAPTPTKTTNPITATTTTIPPGQLAKISPVNNATGVPTSLSLNWGGASDVSYYLYCYDLINNNNCDRFWTATYSTSANISGLQPGQTYYWEVVAVKPSGTVFLDNGAWWKFSLSGNPPTVTPVSSLTPTAVPPTTTLIPTATQTVVAPPFSPTPTSTSTTAVGSFGKIDPANKSAGNPSVLRLNWGSVSGALYYIYCLDTVNNNACDTSWSMSGSTNATVSGLTPGATYYWQVVAVKSSGAIFADNGGWWSFSVSGNAPTQTPIPPTATLVPTATQTIPGDTSTPSPTATAGGSPGGFTKLSPPTGSTGNPVNPVLSWGAVSGASYYLYCYDTVNNNICDASWINSTQTSVTINSLSRGMTYYWQVLVIKPSGALFADNGVWWNFTTTR